MHTAKQFEFDTEFKVYRIGLTSPNGTRLERDIKEESLDDAKERYRRLLAANNEKIAHDEYISEVV
jgi:guanylate kinase